MVELTAKSPCDGLLPVKVGEMSLSDAGPDVMTLFAGFTGREADFAQALKAAHGLTLPAPGRSSSTTGARAIWFGRGQVMVLGPVPDPGLMAHAAATDQSDGWAVVRLDGPRSADVLARLVPIDLRQSSFEDGLTARTQLMHMTASITRVSDTAFQIMVFRSMARTLVHDLQTAMEAVAARG